MDSSIAIRRRARASGGSEGRLFRQEICLLSLNSRDTKAIGSMLSIATTLNTILIGEPATSVGLQFFEVVNELGEFAFTDTPLVTEFKSRQLFALQHTQQSALRHLQHVSGLPESQKT